MTLTLNMYIHCRLQFSFDYDIHKCSLLLSLMKQNGEIWHLNKFVFKGIEI